MESPGADPIVNLLYRSRNQLLDREGRLREKTQCRKCGYELFGLHEKDRCPECGTPVAISMGGDLLRLCEPRWLVRIVRSMRTSTWAMVALLLTTPFCVLLLPPVWAIFPQVLVSANWGFAAWSSSELEPSEETLTRAHWIVRIGTVAVPALWMIGFGLSLTASGPPRPMSMLLGLLAWTGMIATWAAQLHLLQKMIDRIPLPEAAETLRRIKLWLSSVYSVLIVLSIGSWATSGCVSCCIAPPITLAALYLPIRAIVLQLRAAGLIELEAREARGTWAFHTTNADVNRPITGNPPRAQEP